MKRLVSIPTGAVALEGDIKVPESAQGIVLFAHGSSSSRHSPRNRFVAEVLEQANLATLMMDLLTEAEEEAERLTRHLRFDIEMLAERLASAMAWLGQEKSTHQLRIGLFGASTGGGAALMAAAQHPDKVGAVVSRGGRPDLAGEFLAHVTAPTLLLVGAGDTMVIDLNKQAFRQLTCEKELRLVPNATHLFEEPGALEAVSMEARDWFLKYLLANVVLPG